VLKLYLSLTWYTYLANNWANDWLNCSWLAAADDENKGRAKYSFNNVDDDAIKLAMLDCS
jgi:hypothetical protein